MHIGTYKLIQQNAYLLKQIQEFEPVLIEKSSISNAHIAFTLQLDMFETGAAAELF